MSVARSSPKSGDLADLKRKTILATAWDSPTSRRFRTFGRFCYWKQDRSTLLTG
jgi:hypothetical protein